MRTMIKYLIRFKWLRHLLLSVSIRLHNSLYKLISNLAIAEGSGTHPKHGIINYQQWFISRCQPQWSVVDIGSHTGALTRALGTHVMRVYGIEIDAKKHAVAEALAHPDNVEFIHADATVFDYAPIAPVDCITLSNVIEHIEDRVGFLQKLIQQVAWNQQPRFLIRVPSIERDWLAVYKKKMGFEYRLDMTHYIEFTEESLRKELGLAGIQITSFETRFGEYYVQGMIAKNI